MPNYASITLIGHLGRDPELRHTPDGQAVAQFSLATSRKRRDEETTTWWRVSLFGRRGETLCRHLAKGDPVLISGEPYQREYTGKDGQMRTSLEVVASDFAFIGSKAAGGDYSAQAGDGSGYGAKTPQRASQAPSRTPESAFNDDIPF